MSKFVTNQTSFKGGLLSEKLFGRTDIREYQEALSVAQAAKVAKQGGVYKREGTNVVRGVSQETDNAFILGANLFVDQGVLFIFTRDLLNGGDDVILNITDQDGNILSEGPAFEFNDSDPEKTIDIAGFSIAVYEDKVYLAHYSGRIAPKQYEFFLNDRGRVELRNEQVVGGATVFRTAMRRRTDGATIKITGVSGDPSTSRFIEISGGSFSSDMVGELILVKGLINVENGTGISTAAYTISQFVNSTRVRVTPDKDWINRAGDSYDIMANVVYDITAPNDYDYTANGTESNEFSEWYQSAWSPRLGWPKTVTVDDSRLIFGGTPSYPATIWASQINDPTFFLHVRYTEVDAVFTRGSRTTVTLKRTTTEYNGDIRDTDPYTFTIASEEGSQITFMESSVNFLVGTNSQEYILSGGNAAVSSKNISFRPHTSHGSAPLRTVSYDNTVIYTSNSKQSLFMFLYNESNGSYVSKELSLLNTEVFTGKVRHITWCEDEGIAYIVTEDGDLIAMTINNETQTLAFTKMEISKYVYGAAFTRDRDNNNWILSILTRGKDGIYLEQMKQNSSLEYVSLEGVDYAFNRLDGAYVSRQIQTGFCRRIDPINNMVFYDHSKLKVGDRVYFRSSDPTVFTTFPATNIQLDTEYYVIPYFGNSGGFNNKDGSGFRLATSLVNAQSNTFIDITTDTGGRQNYLDTADVTIEIHRDNSVIPTVNFDDGKSIKYFAWDGSQIISGEFTVAGNEYDLGVNYEEILYGETYLFHVATMPIEAGQQWGSAQLGVKRVDKASARLYQTKSYEISTDGYNSEDRVFDNLYTGRDEVVLTSNPEYDHIIHIQNNKAEPCYLTNLVMRGVSNDG